MAEKIRKEYVWECDYGERNSYIEPLKTLLAEQNATQMSMMCLFVGNNPYNLEFFIALGYENPELGQVEKMKQLMISVGSRYRPDITTDELMESTFNGRFDATTLGNSIDIDNLFNTPVLFSFSEKKRIGEKVPMQPLGKALLPVFLGHASHDKPDVESLIPYLSAAGLPVWFDKFNIEYGQSIVNSIQLGIEDSGAVIFWITKSFLKSSWCKTEMQNFLSRYSSGHNVLLLSVVSDEVLHEDLPLFLRELKYLKRKSDMYVGDIANEIIPALRNHLRASYLSRGSYFIES